VKFLAILLVGSSLVGANYPGPPPEGSYVLDQAQVIDNDYEMKINALCLEVERKTTAEMAVLTIATTEGQAHWLYATEVGNEWGVGQENQDNGLLMLVAVQDREVFTATGSGMEAILPDAIIDQIYRNVLVPSFRAEDYGKGIYEALQLYAKEIEKGYGVELEGTQGAPSLEESKSSSSFSCLRVSLCVPLPIIIFFLIISLLGRARGKDRRSGGFWLGGGGFSSSGGGGFSGGGGGGFGGGGFSGGGGGGGW
jgi:uncharacterized protein